MKIRFFLAHTLLFMLSYSVVLAQKPIMPAVESLKLRLSDYKNLDVGTSELLKGGYVKVAWPIEKGMGTVKNSAYKLLIQDGAEKIIEILHSEDKQVFRVNMYLGYTAQKWSSFSDTQKATVITSFFLSFRDMINKEYDASETGQKKVWGNYKAEDYNVPNTFLKGLDDRNLGYFANWGVGTEPIIVVETHNSQYVVVSLRDPKALSEYFTRKK